MTEEEGDWANVGYIIHPFQMGQGSEKSGQKTKVEKICKRRSDGRACKQEPIPLPMVCTNTGPHQVSFSNRTALNHLSHPITANAGLPKRARRA